MLIKCTDGTKLAGVIITSEDKIKNQEDFNSLENWKTNKISFHIKTCKVPHLGGKVRYTNVGQVTAGLTCKKISRSVNKPQTKHETTV